MLAYPILGKIDDGDHDVVVVCYDVVDDDYGVDARRHFFKLKYQVALIK